MKQKLPKEARLLFLCYALRNFFITLIILIGLYLILNYVDTDLINLPQKVINFIAIILIFSGFISFIKIILRPTIGYQLYTYDITPSAVYLKKGYLTIVESYFPMERLQKVETFSGPIMRFLGLKGLTLFSAGSTLSITALKAEVADNLSNQLIEKINLILKERDDES